MKDGYLMFIENKSWLLIQMRTVSIIGKKSSSQVVNFGCKGCSGRAFLGGDVVAT
jgi:hypothetical protein